MRSYTEGDSQPAHNKKVFERAALRADSSIEWPDDNFPHPIDPKRHLAQDHVGYEYCEVTQHIDALGFATKMGVGTFLD